MRSPGPQEHEKGAERFDDSGQDDDENREKAKRPESPQLGGDGIVRRRRGTRFARERWNVLRQIRGVACHGRFLLPFVTYMMQRIAALDSRSIYDYFADHSADTPPAKDPGLSETPDPL
jgi:hypothetical protein